jgi:CheY-like chemotaxis protein
LQINFEMDDLDLGGRTRDTTIRWSVLIVDDDPLIRELIREVLEPLGCDIAEASDGKVACEMCSAARPDIVVLDLVMPEQEGIETLRVLRRDVPGTRVVAMSGALGGTFLRAAKLLGADAVLSKPFTAEQLVGTIRKVRSQPSEE